jgi:hypothetical protein
MFARRIVRDAARQAREREAMKKAKRGRSMRSAAAALLSALVFTLVGDRGAFTAVPAGIDPLEVLNLSVRANALVVLDSSGSMRESPSAEYTVPVPDTPQGELTGDDSRSKLAQAKSVLRTIVQANETKVSFQFGRYQQNTASYGPEPDRPYVYTATCDTSDATCNTNASNILISNSAGAACNNASCNSFLWRTSAHRWTIPGTTTTIYSLFAGRFYNGQRFEVRQNGSNGVLLGDNGDFNLPWVEVQTRSNTNPFNPIGAPVRFTFSGVRWTRGNNSTTSCGGFESLVGLAPCTDNLQLDAIGPHLDPEVRLDPATGNILDPDFTPVQGIRASGFTPIANSLTDIRREFNNNIWPGVSAQTPRPRTFVIFVTDGDDSCPTEGGAGTTDTATANNRALRAAFQAERLFRRQAGVGEPASSVSTFVIAYGTGAAADRANWIAWGGSGMIKTATSNDDAGAWTTQPTPAERAACTTCRDAFVASNTAELSQALQTIIDQGQSTGEYSDQQSITESIFEYAPVSGQDPLDPRQRYSVTLPVLLQSTFEMPGFEGHLKAFRNVANTSFMEWDAAQRLQQRLAPAWTGTATFDQLRGAAAVTPDTIAASTAFIKRRIYTTTRNGVFLGGTDAQNVNNLTTPRYQPAEQVPIWPPSATVHPAPSGSGYPAGVLDGPLGLLGLPTQTDTQKFDALRTEFGACEPVTSHTDCGTTTGTPQRRLQRARWEARQMVLAHAAGADVARTGTTPLRTSGFLLFRKRGSLLAESTLAAPAVVTPPLEGLPAAHQNEYKLFRNGPRTVSDVASNGIANGFGLRNPDLDANAPPSGPDTRTTLKPVMSVVYHGSNHMLHAFRAGPQSMSPPATSCTPSATNECGGEELWAFVPYDQLGKLRERMRPQARDPHTYMIAAPVRFADVFVPGSWSRTIGGVSVSGAGVWRTVILFGRGIGGKHLTAIDVTSPGPFTATSLSTAPPIVLWNRGNPDTWDGTPGGTRNNTLTTADYNAYLTMGQTWSVPSVGFVTAASNTTARKTQGVEFVAHLGSGYGTGGNAANEGTHIYTLDVLTGDVIGAVDVGDRGGMGYPNAIVAPAAGFNPKQMRAGWVTDLEPPPANPAASKTTLVYVGDVHGRVWRLNTDTPAASPLLFGDLGANQPVANGAALLNYMGSGTVAYPHVFIETGNDNRVTPLPASTPPFRLYGLRDEDLASDPSSTDGVDGPARVLFTVDLPDGFRGNVQPATAFDDADPPNGRVFFAATRFNLPNSPNAPLPPPCRSSFDSLLFALGAESGAAAYDLSGSGDDRFVQVTDQRIQAVRVAGGRLVVDMGLGAQNPPPPPAPPVTAPPAPDPISDVSVGVPLDPVTGLPRIAGLVPYKLGSAVCR